MQEGALNVGILKQKGTGNAIHSILNIWEDAKQYQKNCITMLYDVSGAYDTITHHQMRRGMEILHLPDKIINYIMNKMKNNTYTVRTAYGETEPFEIKRGCPQGDPLSPIVYIMAMNPLHVGLRRNPLHKKMRDGYEMENRDETGEKVRIASKGYADDTAILTGSEDGMKRLTEWVNEFCVVNRISMNAKKCMLFGIEEGKEWEESDTKMAEIITQIQTGKEHIPKDATIHSDGDAKYAKIKVKPIRSDDKRIKYQGVRMNMKFDWSHQILAMNRTVGWFKHIAIDNNLSPSQTVLLFNTYLKPKLEYGMRFSDVPESDTIKWGKELRWVLSNKISLGRPVKAEALKIGMGLEDPHEYYITAQAVEFQSVE